MKLSQIKNFFKFNDENKTKVIGLLTILIAIWLVLYFIPEVFISLFNTLLGNLILLVSVLLIYMNNRVYGLIIGLILLSSCKTPKTNCDAYSSYEIKVEHCHIDEENYCYYTVDTIHLTR